MSITYGRRSLTTLLRQTSAVSPDELSEALDTELATQTELEDLGDITTKADKTTAIATADGVAVAAADAGSIAATDAGSTAAADAALQTGAYVQADVQSIADLANELKTDYNGAVTLINELKTDYNGAVTLINELKSKLNTLTTLVNELKSTVNTMNA